MIWIKVAAVLGFLGVTLGAFGAHALKKRVTEERLVAYKTGVTYHLVHAPAVLALGMFGHLTKTDMSLPAGLLTAGIVLFSGSLYAMTITGIKKLGIITPIGGLLFLGGWLTLLLRLPG